MPEEHKSFWTTVPGIITAFATLVTAVGGFIIVLNQVGFFGNKAEPKKEGGVVDQRQLEGMSESEMKSKQQEFEARMREMEQKLAQQNAQQPQPNVSQQQSRSDMPFQETARIGGTWVFANGAYWIVSQSGVSATLQEYSYYNYVLIQTAYGQGTIVGKTVFFTVANLQGGSGKADLTLSDDQTTLSGYLKDNYGNALMSLYLSRSGNFDD